MPVTLTRRGLFCGPHSGTALALATTSAGAGPCRACNALSCLDLILGPAKRTRNSNGTTYQRHPVIHGLQDVY